MAFLFRKYTRDLPEDDISQDEADPVPTEEIPELEFTLFPPSPKAQIILIATGFFLFNILLIATFAILMFNYF